MKGFFLFNTAKLEYNKHGNSELTAIIIFFYISAKFLDKPLENRRIKQTRLQRIYGYNKVIFRLANF